MNFQSCPKAIAPGFVISNVTELHKHHYAASRISFSTLSYGRCGIKAKVPCRPQLAWCHLLWCPQSDASWQVWCSGVALPSWLIHSCMYQLALTLDTTALLQRHKGSLLSPGMPQTLWHLWLRPCAFLLLPAPKKNYIKTILTQCKPSLSTSNTRLTLTKARTGTSVPCPRWGVRTRWSLRPSPPKAF